MFSPADDAVQSLGIEGCQLALLARRADDHCSNDKNVETPWVGLLLSKVATGHECVMRHDNTKLTAAPQGYDSVSVSGPSPIRKSHI